LGGRVDVLQQLYGLLDERLALLGFPTQRRPFRPHLTLARVKDRIDTGKLSAALQEIGNFDPVPFRVAELILFRSDLRPRGAVYTKLAGQLLDPGA
jgi:2'-5' RNA ligase